MIIQKGSCDGKSRGPQKTLEFSRFFVLAKLRGSYGTQAKGRGRRGDFSMVRIRLARFALPRFGFSGSKSGVSCSPLVCRVRGTIENVRASAARPERHLLYRRVSEPKSVNHQQENGSCGRKSAFRWKSLRRKRRGVKINFHRVLLGFFENWDKSPQKKWDKGVIEALLNFAP